MFEVKFNNLCIEEEDALDVMNTIQKQIEIQKALNGGWLPIGPIEFQLPNGDFIQAEVVSSRPGFDKPMRRKRTLRDYAKEAAKLKSIGDATQQSEQSETSSVAPKKAKMQKRNKKTIKRKSKKPVRI